MIQFRSVRHGVGVALTTMGIDARRFILAGS